MRVVTDYMLMKYSATKTKPPILYGCRPTYLPTYINDIQHNIFYVRP